MRYPSLVDVYSHFRILLLGHLMSTYFPRIRGDLADLLGEARCAARCFEVFIDSLSESDWQFIEQQPDLTHQYCVKRSSECTLCLEVCQWPRTFFQDCANSCKSVHGAQQQPLSVATTSTAYPPTIATPTQDRPTCLSACQFSGFLIDQSNLPRVSPVCPLVDSWPPSCQHFCRTDRDCGLVKCCPQVVCGSLPGQGQGNMTSVCTPGVPAHIGDPSELPAVPQQPSIRQLKVPTTRSETVQFVPLHQYKLELDWPQYYKTWTLAESRAKQRWYPAVFLVQLRLFADPSAAFVLEESSRRQSGGAASDSHGDLVRSHLFGEWRNLVWTTNLGAMLSDLGPGTWYQFRILAVSSSGFGGWSRPSRQVYVFDPPTPPSSPDNLTEMKSRLFDHHVDVTIQWTAPKVGNLPLKKYVVTWCQYFGFSGSDQCSVTEYHASVPADKNQYTIQNMRPGTAYKIELTAVSEFEEKEFVSRAVKLYISTKEIPTRKSSSSATHSSNASESCQCGQRPLPLAVVGEAYLEDQQLKASFIFDRVDEHDPTGKSTFTIEWTPRVCIETTGDPRTGVYQMQKRKVKADHLRRFVLTGLSFQCHYRISICRTGNPPDSVCHPLWTDCFCTPACNSVRNSDSGRHRNCSKNANWENPSAVHLNYTILPRDEVIVNSMADEAEASVINYMALVNKTNQPERRRFDAFINWYLLTRPGSIPGSGGLQSRRKRSWESGPKHSGDSGIRGVRVTWGPRLLEPVPVEFYQKGLAPHLDPERTQSKVLPPRHSRLLLKGLQQEVVYIVHVQLIGTHRDGPVSSLVFTVPGSSTSTASSEYWSPSRMSLGVGIATILTLLFGRC